MDLASLTDKELTELYNKRNTKDLGSMSDEQLLALYGRLTPPKPQDIPEPKKEEELGAWGRLKSGAARQTEDLISGARTAFDSVVGDKTSEQIAKESADRKKKIEEAYPSSLGLDRVSDKYNKEGVLSAAGEVARQIPEAVGTVLPTMAGGVVGGLMGGPAGAAIGMGGTSFITQYGSNLERQFEEQAKAGKPIDADKGAAAIGALAQAGLDTVGFMIPFGKAIVSPFMKAAEKGGVAAAEKLAAESITKTLAKGTAVGMLAEVPTEVAQQMIERYQAGLDLFGDDALKEYGDIAYQTAISMVPLGGPGRMLERSGAKREVAQDQANKEDAERLKQEETQYLGKRQAEFEKADLARQEQERALAEEASKAAGLGNLPKLPAPPERAEGPAPAPDERTVPETRGDNILLVGEKSGNPVQGGFRTMEEAQQASDIYNKRIKDLEEQAAEEQKKNNDAEFVKLANQIKNAGGTPIYLDEVNTGLAAKIFNARMAREGDPHVLDQNAPFTTPQEINALELNEDRNLTVVQKGKNGKVVLKAGPPKPDELNLSDRLLQAQNPGIDVNGLTVKQEETTPPVQQPQLDTGKPVVLQGQRDNLAQTERDQQIGVEKAAENWQNSPVRPFAEAAQKAQDKVASLEDKLTEAKNNVQRKALEKRIEKAKDKLAVANEELSKAQQEHGVVEGPYRPAEVIGQQKAEHQEKIKASLKEAFDKLGLTKQGISPEVVGFFSNENGEAQRGANAVESEYDPKAKTITFASDIYDPNLSAEEITNKMVDTLNHEVVHSLNAAGLFTQPEWNTLNKYVKNGEGRRFLERVKLSHPDLSPEQQIEEAISEASRAFKAGDFKPAGAPRNLFKRIMDFFKGIFSVAKRNNTTPDQIFNAIRTGEIGSRTPTKDPTQSGKMQSRVGSQPIKESLNTPEEKKQSDHINNLIIENSKYLSKLTEKEGTITSQKFKDYVKEVIDPFHMLGEGADKFRIARALLVGNIAEMTRKVNDYVKTIGDAKGDKQNIYKYLTTKGATPDAIKNVHARNAAAEVKNLINEIGDELVKQGLLAKEERAKFADSYLPRVYMAYIDKKHVMGGMKPSFQYYLEKRHDLTEEQRVRLGEIDDPAFLVQEALFAPLRDLAILNFFKKINDVGKGQWILGMDEIKYTNPAGHTYQKSLPDLKMFKHRLERMVEDGMVDPSKADVVNDEIAHLSRFIDKVEKDLDANIDKGRYIKVSKDDTRFGPLSGVWLARPIYRDIMGMGSFIPNNMSEIAALFSDGGLMAKANRRFKAAKVAMNPPTIITNVISNTLMMHFADVSMHRIFPTVASVFKEIVLDKKGKYYDLVHKYGLKETTLSEAELHRLYDDLRNRETSSSGMNNVAGLFTALSRSYMNFEGKASNLYGSIETVFKAAIIKDAMEKQGLTEEEAVLKANKYLFDYSEVHDSVKALRNIPFGAPFLTWSYKMTPLLVETALKKPLKLVPYMGLFAGVAAYATMAMQNAGGDSEDREKAKKYLSKAASENPFVMVYSPTDAFDFGKYMPFNNIYKFGDAMLKGDIVAALKAFGFLGGPIADLGSALTTQKDPFTGKDIFPKGSTYPEKTALAFNFALNTFLPSFMKDLPSFLAGHGMGDVELIAGSDSPTVNLLKKVMDDPTGKKPGLPVKDYGEIMANILGFNIYHPSFTQFAMNVNRFNRELDDIKIGMNRALDDATLSKSERESIVKKYKAMIEDKSKELREFVKDSKLSPKIIDIVRQSVEGTK